MKLISENCYEDRLLKGLTRLFYELDLDVESFHHRNTVAMTFWGSEDIPFTTGPWALMSPEEKDTFLLSIEQSLMEAMISAGYEVICKELENSCSFIKTMK